MPSVRARLSSVAGSFVFFWLAPATVAGWVPWRMTRWRMHASVGAPVRWLGAALVTLGAIAVVECFARFAAKGLGTPAPVLPTEYLVVSGLYRHVRNPMYLGVLAAIVGQALLFGSLVVLEYAALVWLCFFAFVALYEEPTLRRRYGSSYESYRNNVPPWWPRITPWPGPPAN